MRVAKRVQRGEIKFLQCTFHEMLLPCEGSCEAPVLTAEAPAALFPFDFGITLRHSSSWCQGIEASAVNGSLALSQNRLQIKRADNYLL